MRQIGSQPRSTSSGYRTCIGCREAGDRSTLLRLVALDAGVAGEPVRVIPDERAVQPGRGAWLHPTRDCLGLATRRRAFGRSLRLDGPVDLTDLVEWISQHAPFADADGEHARTGSGFDADEHPMSTHR